MAVTKRLRYEILRRDNHACRYCGATAPDVKLTIDHVVPTALGGTDEPTNLVTACAPCNSGKSASNPDAPLVANVADDAVRWAAAMRRAAEMQAVERHDEHTYVHTFTERWQEWHGRDGEPFLAITGEHIPSLLNFRRAGLSLDDLAYATGVAMNATQVPQGRLWRYFCGICWRLIEERREIAASLIQAEEASPDGT
ncbi:HNH endonuclease [Pseudonocardia sp.]|uniref:HNH endonuclease n=1 Tax=Pseudonocardia sp. TaxID=60912 RepID=UPI003D11E7F6